MLFHSAHHPSVAWPPQPPRNSTWVGPSPTRATGALKVFVIIFSPLSVSVCCAGQSLFDDHRVHFVPGCGKFVCRPISVGMSSSVVTYTTWGIMGGVQLIVEPRAFSCVTVCVLLSTLGLLSLYAGCQGRL